MTQALPGVESTHRNKRRRGALLGLACGDALGTTLEFRTLAAAAFPQLATGPHREITGGGPFGVLPGQVTDDTQMACCLAASLKEHNGFRPTDIARRYVEWTAHAFDIGRLTHDSLAMIARGVSLGEASRRAWIHSNRQSAGNGSLMRTAPIAVALVDQPDARRLASLADSAITHFDPRCRLACAAFNAAIAAALTAEPQPGPDAIVQAARGELDDAADTLGKLVPQDASEVEAARIALHDDLRRAACDDPDLYHKDLHIHLHQGFVRIAFRLAFWELIHAGSFEAALVDVVNRGGDADTNGAVTGALLGSFYGEASIPPSWRACVLDALQDEPPGPLRDIYHPRRLLDLIAGA
jgi:ADP-ribosylglycohydrolase